jgi:hypothetical protein
MAWYLVKHKDIFTFTVFYISVGLKDNIRMDLTGIGWGVEEWIHLVRCRDQLRGLVNTVMNLWVP